MEREAIKKCPSCGAKVTNLHVNYCMKCRAILWKKDIVGRKYL